MPLTARQRQYLRGLAHPLAPVVRIGKGRVSVAVIAETRRSFEAHELIKVRLEVDDSAERRSLSQQLAEAVGAEVAGNIGKLAILYRAHEEPEIELP